MVIRSATRQGRARAVEHIHDQIAPVLRGLSVLEQQHLDAVMIELDGTPNRVSLAPTPSCRLYGCRPCRRSDARAALYRYLGGLRGGLLPYPS